MLSLGAEASCMLMCRMSTRRLHLRHPFRLQAAEVAEMSLNAKLYEDLTELELASTLCCAYGGWERKKSGPSHIGNMEVGGQVLPV